MEVEMSSDDGEVRDTVITEPTETVEPPASETPVPELPKPATEIEKDDTSGDETPEVEAYKPNTKVKVFDKDYDIPEKYHSLMTDADSEKEIRELFEKANGIETFKTRLNETRSERDQERQQKAEITGSINEARTLYSSALKDGNYLKLDQFWKKLEIPQEVLFNYVREKLKFSELPPEQQQILESKINAERQTETLSQENQRVLTQVQEQARQVKSMMLEQSLSRPDVQAALQHFEKFVGKPGAFKNEVMRQGHLAFVDEKKDLTPDEAIERVIKNYNLQTTPNAEAAAQPGGVNGAGKQVIVTQRNAQTIPNVQGRSTSPMKQRPKNIEDLKKLYKQAAEAV